MTDLPGGPPPNVGGGGLSKKIAGLPTWGWIAIAAAGGIGLYVWLQSRKSAAPTGDTLDNSNGSSDPNGIGAYASDTDQALLAQIRDLQGAQSTATGDDTSSTPSPVALVAPENLRATTVTGVVIVLTWDGVEGARGYDISWTDQQNHTGSGTSLLPGYTMARLPRSEKYMIKVRAKHDLAAIGGGTADGPWSNTITVTTKKV